MRVRARRRSVRSCASRPAESQPTQPRDLPCRTASPAPRRSAAARPAAAARESAAKSATAGEPAAAAAPARAPGTTQRRNNDWTASAARTAWARARTIRLMDQVPDKKDQEYEKQYRKELVEVTRRIVCADAGLFMPFVGVGGQHGDDAVDTALNTAGKIVCLEARNDCARDDHRGECVG